MEKWKSTGSLLWVNGLRTPHSFRIIPTADRLRCISRLRKDHYLVGTAVVTCIRCTHVIDSSSIIDDIQDMCQTGFATCALFYFDFRDTGKQDARHLLSSILIQLCYQSNQFSAVLSSFYSTHSDGSRQPSVDALLECLEHILKLPSQGALYVIIDALDECPNSSGLTSLRAEVLDILRKLVEWHLPHVHFCITSRSEIDIRDVLEPLANHRVSLHSQVGQRRDIIDYITSVVYSHPSMQRWREEDKKLVIDTLIERAGGM